jgi:DNA-binding transcriptional regulator YdaS (Cro superfamily)
MDLHDYLRSSRTAQADFGRLVGVSQGRVSQWLRGDTIPLSACRLIERATAGAVRCQDLRPDVIWTRNEAGEVTGYHVRLDPPRPKAAAA